MENRFNLIEEKWIPIIDVGKVSLRDIFTNPDYRALGGNPVQKIALTKLLLAIAQAAFTPKDNAEWESLGPQGLATHCLEYLNKWQNRFYLYGEKPFLQMPGILKLIEAKNAKIEKSADKIGVPKVIGTGLWPDLPWKNDSILTQSQISRNLSDAEKALFIVMLMNFALGGKRTEKNIINFSGKIADTSAKSGPSLGNHVGYLHSLLVGKDLLASLWLNLLTQENLRGNRLWENGLGVPPWENMPQTETCETANKLKSSYMGCLVAMSRFVYLDGEGIHYFEGIKYPSHKEGWREPSISFMETKKDGLKMIWINPNKRPWRELTALLSFADSNDNSPWNCEQIQIGYTRANNLKIDIGVWSGGLKVRGNSGDQQVKQDDDFVESCVLLPSEYLGKNWFTNLKQEMAELDGLSKIIYSCIRSYFKTQNMEAKDTHPVLAQNLFWQLCEPEFQNLVNACDDNSHRKMRAKFAAFVYQVYNQFCPQGTARQLDAWAKNRPNLGQYLKDFPKDKEAAK